MRIRGISLLLVCAAALLTSCASSEKQVEQDLKRPIHCATAEGDIRVLQHEKAHVGQQIAAGVEAIVPIGLVANVATGSEGTKVQVATGEYNRMIDAKIAEIKRVCGVK
jgi:hypothetical protein